MLCVKESTDIARAISTLIEANATDRAFLEVHVSDLVSLVPTLPGWERVSLSCGALTIARFALILAGGPSGTQVWFLADASSPGDVNATLGGTALNRTWAFEWEPDFWASANWTATIE